MKTMKKSIQLAAAILLSLTFVKCSNTNVDPQLVLDDELMPAGMHQIDNPSADALSRLEELRIENPKDQFFYLAFDSPSAQRTSEWIFPQTELKIEYVDAEQVDRPQEAKNLGIIVKKIKGDYRDEAFTVIEQMPKPANGRREYYRYLGSNMQYPTEAKEAGIEGRVFVEFIIDKDGSLIDLKVLKGIDKACDNEAIRVLKDAPNWIPGKVAGIPVKVKMILPISYKLS